MRKRPSAVWRARYEADAGEREIGGGRLEMGWDGSGETRETERKKRTSASIVSRSRVHPPPAGPGPSRLNAVKLSSYSHKGNSLSQPVKYKRVFPAGRFSTPIVFWAGLLFSVALRHAAPRRATLPTIISTNNDDRSLLVADSERRAKRTSFRSSRWRNTGYST